MGVLWLMVHYWLVYFCVYSNVTCVQDYSWTLYMHPLILIDKNFYFPVS